MRTRGGGGYFEDSRFVEAVPTETTNDGCGGKVGPGLLGDGALKPGKSNMRLVARAIREGWPVSDEVKRDLVDQMHLVGTCSDVERNQIAAARVAIEMENANIKREQMALDLRIAKMRQGEAPQAENQNTLTVVNNVSAGVVVPQAILNATDDELRRIAGIGSPSTGIDVVSASVLPASADGSANGVSRNGQH